MYIIIDKKIPAEAKRRLGSYGQLLELSTAGITYEAISGHPDIFFHQMGETIVYAPNTPEHYVRELEQAGIELIPGEQDVGEKYPASSAYNAVSTPGHLIHNFRNTDAAITRLAEDADLIHVDQGYTRCNLLALSDDHFITSDEKIHRVLGRFGKDCLYVDPEGIELQGFRHGFFGGCCGIHQKQVFILGALDSFKEGGKVREYLIHNHYEHVELHNGPLLDGGSILFADNQG
jgi:hypothetical protein